VAFLYLQGRSAFNAKPMKTLVNWESLPGEVPAGMHRALAVAGAFSK
jgi:hypothetical protein